MNADLLSVHELTRNGYCVIFLKSHAYVLPSLPKNSLGNLQPIANWSQNAYRTTASIKVITNRSNLNYCNYFSFFSTKPGSSQSYTDLAASSHLHSESSKSFSCSPLPYFINTYPSVLALGHTFSLKLLQVMLHRSKIAY